MPFRRLIEGYIDFYKSYFENDKSLYRKLAAQGQNPETLIIACSDSRIDPAIVTTSGPGDLFVVRNVAAIVPPYETDGRYHGTSAAIEFAVKALKVRHVVVMGHGLCGGVQALADRERTNEKFDFIGPWIDIGKNTLKMVSGALQGADAQTRQKILEQALVLTSLENLLTFPWIREKAESGKLKLHGWYFDFQSGVLQEYDPETKRFRDVLKQSSSIGRPAGKGHDCGGCNFSVDGFLAARTEKLRNTGT